MLKSLVLWFFASMLIVASPYGALCASTLTIKNGKIDSPKDLIGPWRLSGKWHFYQNQIVLPPTESCPQSSDYLDIFEFWQKDSLDANPQRVGTSSFCIEISNPEQKSLAFWWPDRGSVDIYANGQLLYGQGRLKEERVTYSQRQIGVVQVPARKRVVLLIHANNDFQNWRKSKPTLLFGHSHSLMQAFRSYELRETFNIAAVLVTGVFQIILFALQSKRRDSLFLAIFCLVVAMRASISARVNLEPQFVAELFGTQVYSFGFVGYYLAVASFYQFLCLEFPRHSLDFVRKALWVLAISFSLTCFIFQNHVYAETLLIFHLAAIVGMISAIYITSQSLIQREQGSFSLALGTTVLSVTALHDMALSQGIGLNFELFPFGQIVFVLSAVALISIRYAHIFEKISHLSHELSKMVPIHVIERIQAGESLERCMPVGENEAVVLVFDIVGSSKLHSPEFKVALEACMGQLHERIHRGYDPKTLKACGYRLKEMGDGLICTIGFPYALPEPKSMEEVAAELAEDLCHIFHKAMASYSPHSPIYCGIGLVKGKIEGFFPSSGPSIYDLRGYAIVLATRYEAMRSLVYKTFGRKGSVIFVHDNVYQSLSLSSKNNFQIWDTTIADQAIRDDREAKHAWFRFIS